MNTVQTIPEHAQLQVIQALMMAYRKHACGDDSIGWEELSGNMARALQEAMGDEAFCNWSESFDKKDENDPEPDPRTRKVLWVKWFKRKHGCSLKDSLDVWRTLRA
jgi:tellurite resistance protein